MGKTGRKGGILSILWYPRRCVVNSYLNRPEGPAEESKRGAHPRVLGPKAIHGTFSFSGV